MALNDLTQQIILLRDVEGKTWEEINEAFPSFSREALRSRYRRARGTLGPRRPDEHLQIQSSGRNTLAAVCTSARIKTLEQLLDACGVDLDEWKVERWGSKAWEGYAKRERTNLRYSAGRADGTIERGGIETETLWSVWAKFVRRVPINVFPAISPVIAEVEFVAPSLPTHQPVLRSVVWSDPQIGFTKSLRDAKLMPFHDRLALDVLLQIIAYVNPDRVDGLGDTFDLPEWTDRFLRAPEFYWTTQPAFYEGHWWMRQIRELVPDAVVTLHEGNHDVRMPEAIQKHLPAAYDLKPADISPDTWPLLSIPHLLGLDQLGIVWVDGYPNDYDTLNDGIELSHGDIARKPGSTTKATVEDSFMTRIVGHIHRQEQTTKTVRIGGEHVYVSSFCPGCLCHIDGRVPGSKRGDHWQQGIAVVSYEPRGRLFSIEPVFIQGGRAIYGGRVFEGRDRLPEIKEAFPGWNW